MLAWIKSYVFAETVAHLMGLKVPRRGSLSLGWNGKSSPLTLPGLRQLLAKRRESRKLSRYLVPLKDTPAERIKAEYNRRARIRALGHDCDSYIDAELVAAGDPGLLWLQQHMCGDTDKYWIEYPDTPVDPHDLDVSLEPPVIGVALIDGKHYRYGTRDYSGIRRISIHC